MTQTRSHRIPAVSAREVWTRNHATNPPGGWYDLCADGTVRDPDGLVAGVPTPCTGTVRADRLLPWLDVRRQRLGQGLDGRVAA